MPVYIERGYECPEIEYSSTIEEDDMYFDHSLPEPETDAMDFHYIAPEHHLHEPARQFTFRCPYRETCGRHQTLKTTRELAIQWKANLVFLDSRDGEGYHCQHCRRRIDLGRVKYYSHYLELIRGWLCWACDKPNDIETEYRERTQKFVLSREDICWNCEYKRDGACPPCWLPQRMFNPSDAHYRWHLRNRRLYNYFPENGNPVDLIRGVESRNRYLPKHDEWPGAIGNGVPSLDEWATCKVQSFDRVLESEWYGKACWSHKLHPIYVWKIQWELEMRGIKATYGRADGPLNPVHEVLWNHLEKPRRRFQAQHREDLVRRCIEIEDEAFAEDRKRSWTESMASSDSSSSEEELRQRKRFKSRDVLDNFFR